MKESRDYFVYVHSTLNDEVFYVGEGCRYRDTAIHNRNITWNEITDKNPYKVIKVKENLTKEEALKLEKELILKYGRLDKGTGTLCNKNDGGIGLKGENNHFYGVKLIGEENGNYGNKFEKNPLSIPIYKLDLKGNIVKKYSSATEAEKVDGYIANNISECCNKKRGIHKGFQFIKIKHYTIPENHVYIKSKTSKIPVVKLKLTPRGTYSFVKLYESSGAVAIDGYNAKCVNACVNKSKKTHKGYYWRKLEELSEKFQEHIQNKINIK